MPQIIKIEIFVLLSCLIFADRHGAICFRISTAVPELWAHEGNYFSTHEAEKTTFTSFPYTNPAGFSERRNRPNMWQMLKEAMMLLLVAPCHVVEARLLQWSPPWLRSINFFVDRQCRCYGNRIRSMIKAVSFSQNAWAHKLEITSVCEGGSLEHVYVVISKSEKYQFRTLFVLFYKTLVCGIWVVYAYTVTFLNGHQMSGWKSKKAKWTSSYAIALIVCSWLNILERITILIGFVPH